MSELKPCPFCGSTDLGQVHRTTQNYVSCHSCGVRMTQSDVGYGDAQKLWNRRAQPAQASNDGLVWREIERGADYIKMEATFSGQPAQAGQVLTVEDLWNSDTIMAANAELGLSMDQIAKFARAIEAAVLAKRVPQWRDIETAPRGSGEDGPSNTTDPDYIEPPHLLLWTQEGIRVGYYDWYYHPGYGRGADPNEPAWRGSDGERLYGPTHWMPCPPPPGIVGEKGGA